ALGWGLGRALSADLALATQQISDLGTERVLRGGARVARPARFAAVAELGQAIEALAERFRIFAAAQERAIEAREAAQRMKGLLFASVSHDLKSPLSAILGLAELVQSEPLDPAQVESLEMVLSRGRELLALIETILDAARVEAGQLALIPQRVPVAELVRAALAKAGDLHGRRDVEVLVDLAEDLPDLEVDPTYGARALGVLVAHAAATAAAAGERLVRLRATVAGPGAAGAPTQPAGPPLLRLDVEHAPSSLRPSLLEDQLAGRSATRGRGLVLALGLARSIVELHGGRVDVGRGPHGAAIASFALPVARD
ncbi:MAG: HAMP domain-containing histidine kinase, partial [Deltaproteobacteria bacterium]|nr:HAMP domain-containing histidine kinase [Deltaproteobacteria bacterium]